MQGKQYVENEKNKTPLPLFSITPEKRLPVDPINMMPPIYEGAKAYAGDILADEAPTMMHNNPRNNNPRNSLEEMDLTHKAALEKYDSRMQDELRDIEKVLGYVNYVRILEVAAHV